MSTSEDSKIYSEIEKDFGIDKKCLINIDKIYNFTVATNMAMTLFATLIIVWITNFVGLLNHKYTTSELFLTTIVLFTVWNILIGFTKGDNRYSISTNTSLLISVLLLPFISKGPTEFIKNFA
jgi:hypothetical protein